MATNYFKISLKGLRPAILRELDADKTIPVFWKAAIKNEIAQADSAFNLFQLDAHFHPMGKTGKDNFHYTLGKQTVAA